MFAGLQVYEEYAEQADDWLAQKEAFLANEDLGNSLSAVDDLIKKHEVFEKTLEAQEEKIITLQQLRATTRQNGSAADATASCTGWRPSRRRPSAGLVCTIPTSTSSS